MQEVIGSISYVGFSINPNKFDKFGNPIKGLDITFKDANGNNFYFKVSNVMPKIQGNSERFETSRLARLLKAAGRFSDVAKAFNGNVIEERDTKNMMQLKKLLSGVSLLLTVENKTVRDIKSLATISPNQVAGLQTPQPQSIPQSPNPVQLPQTPQATFSGFGESQPAARPRASRRGING